MHATPHANMYKAWMIDDMLGLLEIPTPTLAILRREIVVEDSVGYPSFFTPTICDLLLSQVYRWRSPSCRRLCAVSLCSTLFPHGGQASYTSVLNILVSYPTTVLRHGRVRSHPTIPVSDSSRTMVLAVCGATSRATSALILSEALDNLSCRSAGM